MRIVFQPGKYLGRVTGQGLGESKDKRTPFFGLSVDILGKINPMDPQGDLLPCPGGQRTVRLWLTDQTADRSIADLQRLGFTGSSFRQLDPASPGGWSIIGADIELYCSQEPDSRSPGEMQEKWGIAREGGLKLEPIDQSGVKKLDALFGKQLKALSKSAPARAPAERAAQEQTVPPEPGGPADDDIPF